MFANDADLVAARTRLRTRAGGPFLCLRKRATAPTNLFRVGTMSLVVG